MCRFIVEYKDDMYVMSFIDDYLPTSTVECKSMDEAVYEMTSLFSKRVKINNVNMIESMTRLRDQAMVGKLPIEFMGINLLTSDSDKHIISRKFGLIADEYLTYVGK